MSKIVEFAKPQALTARMQESLRVIEQAYAYYAMPEEVSAEAAIEAVEAPIEQMFTYYPAA